MGASQRRKGANWERQVVNDLVAHGFEARRTAPLQTNGADVPDVMARPLWVECKVGARPPIVKGLEQARETMPPRAGWLPCCVAKQDRQRPTVTLLWDDFLDLLQEWRERGR